MPRRHRSHSAELKRQVVAEFQGGETLHALGRRHDLSRNLIRVWIEKAEAGALDEDVAAASAQHTFMPHRSRGSCRSCAMQQISQKQWLHSGPCCRSLHLRNPNAAFALSELAKVHDGRSAGPAELQRVRTALSAARLTVLATPGDKIATEDVICVSLGS